MGIFFSVLFSFESFTRICFVINTQVELSIISSSIFLMGFPIQPFQRGFFCNDESIRLPYFESTVSAISLYSFGLLIPVLMIFGGEYVHHVLRKDTKLSNRHFTKKPEIANYYRSVFRKILCFVSGALYGYFISLVGKFTVGRLRPNFIALCGIDLSTVCRGNPYEYIFNFTCPNGEFAGNDGRISFPSDHAIFSFYAAVFTVLYLQKRMKCRSLFWKPLLQFLILLLAWWISLTRVMNNQHHMSDVIAGIFIGSGTALINTISVHSFFEDDDPVLNSSLKYNDVSKEVLTETRGLLSSTE